MPARRSVRPSAFEIILEADETQDLARLLNCNRVYAVGLVSSLAAWLHRRRSPKFSGNAVFVAAVGFPDAFDGLTLAATLAQAGWASQLEARDGHPYFELRRWGDLFPEEQRRTYQRDWKREKDAEKRRVREAKRRAALPGVPPPPRPPTTAEAIAQVERLGARVVFTDLDD